MKITDYTTANGISLTKPETNLSNQLSEKYGLLVSEIETTAVNQFTKQEFPASPISAALVRFLNVAYRNYILYGKMSFASTPVTVSIYDRTKYLLLKLDKETYFNTID